MPKGVSVTPLNPISAPVQISTRKTVAADKRLDAKYFSGNGQWPTRIPPPIIVSDEIECLGLHGEGYREYAWQRGVSYTGGVSPIDTSRMARILFPYKSWGEPSTASESEDSEESSSEAHDHDEVMPERAVRAACVLSDATQVAMKGVRKETNNLTARAHWTNYEKDRLHQSMVVAARWTTQPNTGSVYAKGCLSVTTNVTGICSACSDLGKLEGLKRVVRRARAKARLPPSKFVAKMKKQFTHTPTIFSHNSAAAVKAALALPSVIKILSAKAKHGPGGAFLSLFQQAQTGDLDDQQSFTAICEGFADRVQRKKDPTGHAMKGIRYSPELGQLAALMRSYGPRSGSQYDLFKGMLN
ncbi:hypothetical protein B0H10DRAFT_2209581 [Mycena sp. CBHHK59/15]|nr:hypothetical protein B0H10DRAFT_2209581 [Mycena sp. CBHHK59/15]